MQTIFLFATATCSIMIVDESHVNVVFRYFINFLILLED